MPAKVAVVIPARYASTRFPGKPLELLAGKPLIQHVWERCQEAAGVDEVIVATDDYRIAEVAVGFGALVSMTSPKHESGTDRCAEVAKGRPAFTHILNVQGDEPLIDPELIGQLIQALLADRKLPMVTAATAFKTAEEVQDPNAVKVVLDRNRNALYFSRSPIPFIRDPKLSTTFLRHLGIYGYSSRFLQQFVRWKPSPLEKLEALEQLRALENGAKIQVLQTESAAIGVDTPGDLVRAEKLLNSSRIGVVI